MPKGTLKTLAMLVVPVVLAMIAQTASAKPYHSRVKDGVAARQQIWSTVGDPMNMGGDTRDNDPNVYRDGQPIPYYDINPHGG
jgi:hypothetical protein